MRRVIIAEGPDRTGKTEISTELSRRLGIPRFKNHRESMFFERDPDYFVHALRYGDPYFVSYLEQTGASVILDRSYPSEFVYSAVFCRKTDTDMLRMVDTMYAGIGAVIVLTYRSTYAGMSDDQFDVIDQMRLQQIDERYEKFSRWTSCRTLRLCVDDEDLDREVSEVISFLEAA